MSFDTEADNKAFAEKHELNFPLLCDVDHKVGDAYGASEPGVAAGYAKRIGVIIGPDGKVKEWLGKVDPKAYPQEALARI